MPSTSRVTTCSRVSPAPPDESLGCTDTIVLSVRVVMLVWYLVRIPAGELALRALRQVSEH